MELTKELNKSELIGTEGGNPALAIGIAVLIYVVYFQ